MVKFRVLVLNQGLLCPTSGDHSATSADIFDYLDWGGRVLLASSELRPGMLLTLLQHTGQLPQKRIIKLKMLIVWRLRNPELESNELQ